MAKGFFYLVRSSPLVETVVYLKASKSYSKAYASFNQGAHMFEQNERVVYPGHGVAFINRILEKKVGTEKLMFYELKLFNKDMTVLVPVANAETVGIRKISSQERIKKIFKLLKEPSPRPVIYSESSATNWNKRNKEYQIKIRSGDIQEICEIYRDLKRTEEFKELTFGEKTLLLETEALLSQEIALVKNDTEDKVAQDLRLMASTLGFNAYSIESKSL